MTRQLSTRVWLVLLGLAVGTIIACSSSTTTPTPVDDDKDSGAAKEDAPKAASKG